MAKEIESFLTRWERVIKTTPRDGYVMPPDRSGAHLAASIICGHDLIQRLPPGLQADFEIFVREVITTTVVGNERR